MQKQNIYYITLATKPHNVLDKLQERVNSEIIVLGKEENRTIGWEGSQNFGLKLREVSKFVNSIFLKPDDIILFTDAYDVACCCNGTDVLQVPEAQPSTMQIKSADVLNDVLTRFKTCFKKPIVFGAETMCNPDPHMSVKYKTKHKQLEFPYLNSGLFIGYVWALQNCIADYIYEDADDDQRFWTRQLLEENSDLIELDYYNVLFLNTVGMENAQFVYKKDENRAFYRYSSPLFVHVNGPDKRMIEMFL